MFGARQNSLYSPADLIESLLLQLVWSPRAGRWVLVCGLTEEREDCATFGQTHRAYVRENEMRRAPSQV